MKALDSKVNIIPVIAKADTITKTELHKFKANVSIPNSIPDREMFIQVLDLWNEAK